jgi:hypothetical protein
MYNRSYGYSLDCGRISHNSLFLKTINSNNPTNQGKDSDSTERMWFGLTFQSFTADARVDVQM